MEFNTQVCTTKEQSERLIALELKKETADMTLFIAAGFEVMQLVGQSTVSGGVVRMGEVEIPTENLDHIPAWSLHRLISMCPNCLDVQPCLHKTITEDSVHYCDMYHNEEYEVYFSAHRNLFDNLIDCIEWLIKEGHFNEEYLTDRN